jgi:SNF2 family DNA or RNA helicase
LVTLGTIEERIDQLISQKGQLLEDVVGVDEQQVLKQFNREELIQLLQFIDLG